MTPANREAFRQVRCGWCGKDNPPGAVYCGGCGARLGSEPLAAEEVAAHPPVGVDSKRCLKCENDSPGWASYCFFCGAPFTGEPAARESAQVRAPEAETATERRGRARAAARTAIKEVSTMARTSTRPAGGGADSDDQEAGAASEDLAHGQIVIVTTRWILILSALLLTIWNPGSPDQLKVQIGAVFGLAFFNFYLHAQLLIGRRALERVVYGASILDIAVITAIVITLGGYRANVFIFYFPALLALSVAFPRMLVYRYTGGTMIIYALVSLPIGPATPAELQVIFLRVLMMAGVGFCGAHFLRIERDRRRAALEAQQTLMAQVRQSGA